MAYRSSADLLLIISAFSFVLGLWRLANSRRLWIAFVVMIGFPAWIMAGPIVYGMSSRTPQQLLGEEWHHAPAHQIRRRGVIAFSLGAAAWCYGAFGSELPRQIELVVLAVTL
ncbi:MAG: hypothetical protein IPP12_15335 [Nitrospira sp.]|nr:hypothetical protein [Nitrospira sp.]